jgi:hypothetical protein
MSLLLRSVFILEQTGHGVRTDKPLAAEEENFSLGIHALP